MSRGRRHWLRCCLYLFAAVISGGLTVLLFAPFGHGSLVWVTLLPLMWALWAIGANGRRWRKLRGFGLGCLAGLVFFLVNVHWLTVVSGVGWAVLSLYLSIFWGLWGLCMVGLANPWRETVIKKEQKPETGIEAKVRERREKLSQREASQNMGKVSLLIGIFGNADDWKRTIRSLRFAFVAASLWCGFEWLRGWVFTGFGWNTLGVAFIHTPVMAQGADLLGVIGLSFFPVVLQAVILQMGRRIYAEIKRGRLGRHPDFAVTALLLGVMMSYGVWRLSSERREREQIDLQVVLVQLNIPQEAAERLWTNEQMLGGLEVETLAALRAIEDRNVERLAAAAELGEGFELEQADWVIWPESALIGAVLREKNGSWATWPENLDTINKVREAGEFRLLMGSVEMEGEFLEDQLAPKKNARIWNSLVMLDPDDEMHTYHKHHLVIFGEYIPLVEKLPLLKKIYEQQAGAEYGGSFTAGNSYHPMTTTVRGRDLGIVPTICFEDTVPRLVRRFVRDEPQVIVNVTNDGWFKDSAAAEQHFANARFRAIELRRPMVRSANTGVSAIIDTCGSTTDGSRTLEIRDEQGSAHTRGWLTGTVKIPQRASMSLYALIGDWGVILLAITGIICGEWRRNGK